MKQEDRVTYQDFLNMWREEIEDKSLNALRGISRQRTVSILADELLANSSHGETSEDDQFLSNRLVSIAEIEERSRSASSLT